MHKIVCSRWGNEVNRSERHPPKLTLNVEIGTACNLFYEVVSKSPLLFSVAQILGGDACILQSHYSRLLISISGARFCAPGGGEWALPPAGQCA